MRALKTLVIGMGGLIVVGIVVLVVTFIDRAGTAGTGTGLHAPQGSATRFAPASVDLPAGAQIVETRIGDGRIVLRLRLADGSGRLVILDAADGRVAGTVELKTR